jgi:hypothetical protein
MGYRSFEERKIEPLWPFGFGLSYTSFTLSNIRLSGTLTTFPGSHVTIHVTVNNTGQYDGHEVVQAYVSPSACIRERGLVSYPKTLAGFTKVWVPAMESRHSSIVIKSEEFRWYDEEIPSWRVDKGDYRCFVGTSAKEIKCELAVEIV